MRALETLYNGISYRSRLEGRWAVYWDHLGIAYDYEPEGFDLGGGDFYLPDFFVPEDFAYYEIKPRWPEIESARRARRVAAKLSDADSAAVIILFGAPWSFVPVRFSAGEQTPCPWPGGPFVEAAISASRSARFWK